MDFIVFSKIAATTQSPRPKDATTIQDRPIAGPGGVAIFMKFHILIAKNRSCERRV